MFNIYLIILKYTNEKRTDLRTFLSVLFLTSQERQTRLTEFRCEVKVREIAAGLSGAFEPVRVPSNGSPVREPCELLDRTDRHCNFYNQKID